MAETSTAYPPPGRAGRPRSDLFSPAVRHSAVRHSAAISNGTDTAWAGLGGSLTTDDAQQVILDIFRVLEQIGLLTVMSDFEGVPGYRLKASTIR